MGGNDRMDGVHADKKRRTPMTPIIFFSSNPVHVDKFRGILTLIFAIGFIASNIVNLIHANPNEIGANLKALGIILFCSWLSWFILRNLRNPQKGLLIEVAEYGIYHSSLKKIIPWSNITGANLIRGKIFGLAVGFRSIRLKLRHPEERWLPPILDLPVRFITNPSYKTNPDQVLEFIKKTMVEYQNNYRRYFPNPPT